jgi:LPS export ABC transporter protein LptC
MKTKITFLLLLIFSAILIAQDSEKIKAKSFSVPEYDEKGKLSCVIKGDTGEIYGKEALITGAVVEIKNDKNPLVLTTNKCKYLMKSKRCTSKESVVIKGDGVNITGQGFDIDNASRRIFIRSKVKVIWKKANLKRNTDDKKTEKKK